MRRKWLQRLFCLLLVVLTLVLGACSEAIETAAQKNAAAEAAINESGLTGSDLIEEKKATATPKATKKATATPKATKKVTATPKATKKVTATPKATKKATATPKATPTATPIPINEDGRYSSKEEVALYIHLYGHLPENFITKDEAEELGWSGGGLERYAPGCSIGGDRFGNREGLLPKAKGRTYTECDIDTMGARSRGAKRIVFSNDGLIYYTEDHYASFTLLYGEDLL